MITKKERENKIVEEFHRANYHQDYFQIFRDGYLIGYRARREEALKDRTDIDRNKNLSLETLRGLACS